MNQNDFDFLRKYLKDQSGLVLSQDKVYLVESRLVPVARKHDIADLDALIAAVRSKARPELNIDVVEAMTTNESFFFRDIKPFESLRDVVLPKVVEARRAAGARTIRIWSAACSSGQEPYTIGMLLKENPQLLQGLSCEIVATDLSLEILAKAKEGIYSQFEAQRGLPIQLLIKYFKQVGEHWQVAPEIRSMVNYQQANLLADLSRFGRFDVVYCRNVLIYFDNETKGDVLGRIRRQMADDAFLYLGGAESVLGISDAFATLPGQRGVYICADANAKRAMPAAPLARTA
ncbi:MAG: chemotaxis protein CheR [Alphaproteobacteria bacterium]|nr:chemotaxis protein CheR [Alphaproteobacteria bacterium]